MKKYRFFFHYRKQTGGMTVHFKGICTPCVNVVCLVPVNTKYNEKSQPKLVLQGFCNEITLSDNTVTIK